MRILDRYTNRIVSEQDLPSTIELGRFLMLDGNVELTYKTCKVKPETTILQSLLDKKNKALHDLLRSFYYDIESMADNHFDIWPLVHNVNDSVVLNDFEILLRDNLFHLKEIFRTPYSLLQHAIVKVNVSRAKRIPAKSYDYLSGHTEDWMEKSIVNFKPLRVLSEELTQNFNVYENQLAVYVVDKCIAYLTSRLHEVNDVESFLEAYMQNLQYSRTGNRWHGKVDRNLSLASKVYKNMDSNYQEENKSCKNEADSGRKKLSAAKSTLYSMKKELLKLRESEMYKAVDKRLVKKVTLRNTNVIVNHKHYKYLTPIFRGLTNLGDNTNEDEISLAEEETVKGMRAYVLTLIAYTITELTPPKIPYEISGNYLHFVARNSKYATIEVSIDQSGAISITVGNYKTKILVVGDKPQVSNDYLSRQNIYVLVVAPGDEFKSSHIISVYPYDVESVEKVGKLLRKLLLFSYVDELTKPYDYSSSLNPFITLMSNESLSFDLRQHSYRFVQIPASLLPKEKLRAGLLASQEYMGIKNHKMKDNVLKKYSDFIDCVNERIIDFTNNKLYCFECGERLNRHLVENFTYLKCSCGFVVDFTDRNRIILKNVNLDYANLTDADWGMDTIVVERSDIHE